MSSEPIRIQRYPNRRLYDRAHRRYVTLAEIEELVRQGRMVKVQDSKTGEDLTRQILTQILLERHPDKMELFPIALLHGLLRANDLAAGLWEAYLRQALLTFESMQRAMPTVPSPLGWLPNWLSGWPGQPPAAAPAPAAPPAADPANVVADRLAALEERIAELEAHSWHTSSTSRQAKRSTSLGGLERRVSGLEEDSAE
jgi:polyhydroxyalkanoate synthesis repressor PhaR